MSAGPHTTSDGGVWTGTPPSRGGGGWHKASVSDCLPLAAPIGLSPLCIPILCVVFGGGSAPLRAILPRQADGRQDDPDPENGDHKKWRPLS